MDPSSYKEVVTRRGIKYSYFASPSSDSSVTVLLLHGFPSTARDWRKLVPAFQQAGYAVIAPDMLGYGGTDKPTEKEQYLHSKMATDMIDILDAEKVEKAVAISHDWGCAVGSRLANYYPERFLAFAFLSVGYVEPHTSWDFQGLLELTKRAFGYELFGYWVFFSEEGAHEVIHQHWDSAYSILFPVDPAMWKTDLAPIGAAKAWMLADKQSPLPPYLTPEDKEHDTKSLLGGVGFAGRLNWYKVVTEGDAWEDNKNIKDENKMIKQPVFFGGGTLDAVCLSSADKESMPKFCANLTVREYARDHWLVLDRPEELNRDLVEWIGGVTAAKL